MAAWESERVTGQDWCSQFFCPSTCIRIAGLAGSGVSCITTGSSCGLVLKVCPSVSRDLSNLLMPFWSFLKGRAGAGATLAWRCSGLPSSSELKAGAARLLFQLAAGLSAALTLRDLAGDASLCSKQVLSHAYCQLRHRTSTRRHLVNYTHSQLSIKSWDFEQGRWHTYMASAEALQACVLPSARPAKLPKKDAAHGLVSLHWLLCRPLLNSRAQVTLHTLLWLRLASHAVPRTTHSIGQRQSGKHVRLNFNVAIASFSASPEKSMPQSHHMPTLLMPSSRRLDWRVALLGRPNSHQSLARSSEGLYMHRPQTVCWKAAAVYLHHRAMERVRMATKFVDST